VSLSGYLFFDGNARAAFDFYKQVFGVADYETNLMTYGEAPAEYQDDGTTDRIINATMAIPGAAPGAFLMLSDQPRIFEYQHGTNVMLVLGFSDPAEQRRVFEALSEGGEVLVPLGKTFFNDLFGIVKDRFGIGWQLAYGMLAY